MLFGSAGTVFSCDYYLENGRDSSRLDNPSVTHFKPKASFNPGASSKQCAGKCSLQRTEDAVGTQLPLVLWTCFVHWSRSSSSLGNENSEMCSLGELEQSAATQRFGIFDSRHHEGADTEEKQTSCVTSCDVLGIAGYDVSATRL